MTDKLQDHIKHKYAVISDVNHKFKSMGRALLEYPSGADLLRAMGYDGATEMGVLDQYKDAWGVNMRRGKDNWQNKWAALYDNIEKGE